MCGGGAEAAAEAAAAAAGSGRASSCMMHGDDEAAGILTSRTSCERITRHHGDPPALEQLLCSAPAGLAGGSGVPAHELTERCLLHIQTILTSRDHRGVAVAVRWRRKRVVVAAAAVVAVVVVAAIATMVQPTMAAAGVGCRRAGRWPSPHSQRQQSLRASGAARVGSRSSTEA